MVIDSIWFVHAESSKQGENPILRTLFFRLCRLAEAPFLPLFVFDGPYRPNFKRGTSINPKHRSGLESGFKRMASAFGYEWHEVCGFTLLAQQLPTYLSSLKAPGEAEAELAYLNEIGKIDAVWSDDVDTLIFGAQVVIRKSVEASECTSFTYISL
jgi:Holliday junction resolvase YEN1